jgi:heme exporter protein A
MLIHPFEENPVHCRLMLLSIPLLNRGAGGSRPPSTALNMSLENTAAPQSPTDFVRLEARGLSCVRNERTLFGDLSFSVGSGQVLQVEGPNGSGKTSLLRILCGLSLPESGVVHWDGAPIQDVRSEYGQALAYVGHRHGVKGELTAIENLAFGYALTGGQPALRPSEAMARLGLEGLEDVPCRSLSEGQRRRAGLARLLVGQYHLWILDEPFTALDRAGIAAMETLVREHTARGGMVVLTTHQNLHLEGCALTRIGLPR